MRRPQQPVPAGAKTGPEDELTVSAVIATRGRPADCARAVTSILRGMARTDRVVVVDQSDDDATESALRSLAQADKRVVYLRSSRRGISAGHNVGAQEASTDLLLFTDDDCIAAANWADEWRSFFKAHRDAGMAFGTVACEPFDPHEGYTPNFRPAVTGTHGRELFWRGMPAVGIGANTAVRRDAWIAACGCDEALGVGTGFGGAEEIDLAYRVIRVGYQLGHAVRPTVMHDGFRPNQAASALVQSNALGAGAMYAKHLRCGDPFVFALFAGEVAGSAAEIALRLMTNRHPLGARRLKALLSGAVSSFNHGIDRNYRLYRQSPALEPSLAEE